MAAIMEIEGYFEQTDQRPRNGRNPQTDSPLGEIFSETATDREEEIRHARDLREARETLAGLFLELPSACRDYVLEGDPRGPRQGHRWPLESIETSFDRLVIYDAAREDAEAPRILEEIRAIKLRLDRAREALVMSNLYIVPHVVKRFRKGIIPFMDLIQDGHIGLLKAVDRFDPERGFRFSTYAYWWIRRSLSDAFTNQSRLIRLPDSLRDGLRKFQAVSHELEEDLGRQPTQQEIAARMNVPIKKVKKLMAVVPEPYPIEDLKAVHSEGWSALVDEPTTRDPLSRTLYRELKEQTQEALQLLEPRERYIVRLRFGFDGGESLTLTEIGKEVGLSRERVRQIERGALAKIQDWASRVGVGLC